MKPLTPRPRFLVVAVAGGASRHPSWWTPDAGFDLQVLPAVAGFTKWQVLFEALKDTGRQWAQYRHVFLPDDDLDITPEEIEALFSIAEEEGFALCQPSLGWRSHFTEAISLHNPLFRWRSVNAVDFAAPCFEAQALAQAVPLFAQDPTASLLGRVIPARLAKAHRVTAVVDAVQVLRTQAHQAEPAPLSETLAAEAAALEAGEFNWGGMGTRGQRLSLFSDAREAFLGALVTGYACAVQEAQVLGEVFLQHFMRSLEPPPAAFEPASRPSLRRSPIGLPA